MIYWILTCLSAFLLDIMTVLGSDQAEKDLEIVALRQQVRILEQNWEAKHAFQGRRKCFWRRLQTG